MNCNRWAYFGLLQGERNEEPNKEGRWESLGPGSWHRVIKMSHKYRGPKMDHVKRLLKIYSDIVCTLGMRQSAFIPI